jgi:hypothetical protein
MLPNTRKPIDIKIKIKQTIISFLEFLKTNTAGIVNKDIQNKLKE